MTMKVSNIKNSKYVLPSNVIKINNVVNQFDKRKFHPATFPIKLVEFFVEIFSNENDIILDPFSGSGTVGLACKNTNRNFILLDNNEEFITKSKNILGL